MVEVTAQEDRPELHLIIKQFPWIKWYLCNIRVTFNFIAI